MPQDRRIRAASGHFDVQTFVDSKVVRINSRNYLSSGNFIGFQCKPAQAANGADIKGGEISPRLNSGFTLSGSIIGLHVDAFVRGTAAGTISGDVRGLNLELVTDDAGTRDITGNVSAIRIRAAFSAGTVSGVIAPIRIEKMEAQTNSEQWGCVLELPSTNGSVWGVKGSDYTPSQPRAKIQVKINGTDYWLVGYAVEPT